MDGKCPFAVNSHRTAAVLSRQDPVTARMRALMTEGASRLRVCDGRVAEKR